LAGQFRFTLHAINGEMIAQSWKETYTQKHSCITTLKTNFPDFKIIDETITSTKKEK